MRRGRRRRGGLQAIYAKRRQAEAVLILQRMHRREIAYRLAAYAMGVGTGWLLATAFVYDRLEGILR